MENSGASSEVPPFFMLQTVWTILGICFFERRREEKP
jgi:hypothetical protein